MRFGDCFSESPLSPSCLLIVCLNIDDVLGEFVRFSLSPHMANLFYESPLLRILVLDSQKERLWILRSD